MIKKILLAVALMLPMLVSAQTLKIGVVSSQEVLTLMPAFKTAQTEIQTISKKYETEFQKLETEMKKLVDEFQAMPETELPAIKEKKARDIQDLQQKAQLFEQQANQDLQKKQDELLQPIFAQLKGAVESVAKEGNFSLVQEYNPQLTYYIASPVVDITPLVKAKLGL